jgi:SAM-dependent methyltransferase
LPSGRAQRSGAPCIACAHRIVRRASAHAKQRIGRGHVLGIDRSAKAIAQSVLGSRDEIAAGRVSFRRVAVESFELAPGEKPHDIAFAVRVGALDGRHPALERSALEHIAQALTPDGRLFLDGGDPLREISLSFGAVHSGQRRSRAANAE